MDVDAGQVDVIGIDVTALNQLLDLCLEDLACHSAGRLEVARIPAEHQNAGAGGVRCPDHRHVGCQLGLRHETPVTELAGLFARCLHRSVVASSEEGSDARAAAGARPGSLSG